MADEKDAQSERPPDSDFQQQNLKAWQPLLTPRWVIGTFAFFGILFVPTGVFVLKASQDVVEVEHKYDQTKQDCPSWQQDRTGCSKPIEFTIPADMKQSDGIFMYYKLTNFYQNHRRYVKSRSDAQLRGDNPAQLTSCEPLETYPTTNGKKLYPCGLIANSYFNDTFVNATYTRDAVTTSIPWTQKGIAWDSDVQKKFKDMGAAFDPKTMTRRGPSGHDLPNVEDEAFIVWMRTAGLPTFKKLRYIITGDNGFTGFQKGDKVTIMVDNVFPVDGFEGEKFIVLSTTSWLGGKNDFLGYAYIIVGSLCLLLAVVFGIKHYYSPRPLGDMKYFNWSNNGASR
jgi:hypothetical protein